MQNVLNQLRVMGLPALLRRFGDWWLKEFVNLFPERVVEFFCGRGRPSLVVAADREGISLELLNGARGSSASHHTTSADGAMVEIDRFLSSQGLQRKDADIGLRLPAESVFCRQLLLPAEAISSIDAIVSQDLAKKTPFKTEDIYSDHTVLEHSGGKKIAVWQWITRRQYVHQALLTLKMDIEHLSFVVFGKSATQQAAPYINLRPRQLARHPWRQKTALALCCSAVMLALLAGGLKYWHQQTTMDRLDAQIATASRKAQHVRALVDQLQEKKNALLHLRLQRGQEPGLIDLWEEVTRVVPSHSWLTEFRLVETAGKREQQVSIVGFSSAAASLVGIMDGSPMFFDAALTSPIAFDATEGRERFALQAKVKMPDSLKEAAR
jgi:general secretion pathway protein L